MSQAGAAAAKADKPTKRLVSSMMHGRIWSTFSLTQGDFCMGLNLFNPTNVQLPVCVCADVNPPLLSLQPTRSQENSGLPKAASSGAEPDSLAAWIEVPLP